MARNARHTPITRAISQELTAYLDGEQTLGEFSEWFYPETWNIHQWASEKVQEVVYAIKLLLAEYSGGVWSEEQLREKLRPFCERA